MPRGHKDVCPVCLKVANAKPPINALWLDIRPRWRTRVLKQPTENLHGLSSSYSYRSAHRKLISNHHAISRFRVVSPPSAPSLRPWLCAACKLIGEGEGTWARLRDHHQSFEAFNEAMRLKCLICTRLWARLYLEKDFTPSRDLGICISYYFAIVSDGEGFTDHYALQFRFSSPDQTQPLDIGFSLLKDNTGTYDGTCEPDRSIFSRRKRVSIAPAPALGSQDHS
jgi:hypothetical protein